MQTEDHTQQLIDELREAVIKHLKARGEIADDETISLKAVIMNKQRARRTITLDDGIDIFRSGPQTLHDRDLSQEEVDQLRQLAIGGWEEQLIQDLVERKDCVERGKLRQLAPACGYPCQRGLPNSDQMATQLNGALRKAGVPFRLATRPRYEESAPTVYRLYALKHDDKIDPPGS